jgi:hypothetical protein
LAVLTIRASHQGEYGTSHPLFRISSVIAKRPYQSWLHINAKLEEDIWIEIPERLCKMFPGEVQDDEVLKLHSAVYDLVQAPRAWMKPFSRILKALELTQSKSDPCLFFCEKMRN